ncbi:unnamed protein product [Caenorhabditis angaria]|uniref:DUF38 domain-containing protein n=1 Tax=Caenorhabditis angaria TaxID=860376 RepID=A0A9P1MXL1_9PELO|nr:unnamed protein product [Caenorhabditis angaria]
MRLFLAVLFLVFLQLVYSLTPQQQAARDFVISLYKHYSFRDSDIIHPDFQIVKNNVVTQTYEQAVKIIENRTDDETKKMTDLFKQHLAYSNAEWEQALNQYNIIKFNDDGLEIKHYKNNKLDFVFFLKKDSNIEGGYKFLRLDEY